MDWLTRLKKTSSNSETPDICDNPEYQQIRRFMDKGYSHEESNKLAKAISERTFDDRRYCLECKFLKGIKEYFRCSNIELSGLGNSQKQAGLPTDLVSIPQRCKGFSDEN
jgi:hypothetical protein